MTDLNHAANPGRHRLANRGDDVNETPVKAVHALLKAERLPNFIWEPACGPGAMVKVLREAGHRVLATDLVDHGCPNSESRIDFLLEHRAPDGVEAIVSNFPFKLSGQFVAHALKLGVPRVITLQRLAFLECKRRSEILDGGQLARVHVFIERLPMMHRQGWTGNRARNAIAFAWFVWDRNHIGPTTIDRISTVSARQPPSMEVAQ